SWSRSTCHAQSQHELGVKEMYFKKIMGEAVKATCMIQLELGGGHGFCLIAAEEPRSVEHKARLVFVRYFLTNCFFVILNILGSKTNWDFGLKHDKSDYNITHIHVNGIVNIRKR
ncbi:hypothetical protein ACJX0J_019443, partial [Zea mays]